MRAVILFHFFQPGKQQSLLYTHVKRHVSPNDSNKVNGLAGFMTLEDDNFCGNLLFMNRKDYK